MPTSESQTHASRGGHHGDEVGWRVGSLDGEQAREADDAEVISASQAAVRPWVGWRCSMASRPKTPKSSGFIDDPKLTRTRS